MTYPRFTNLDVECWEHAEKLGFATPTMCLFHSKIESGRQILEAHTRLDIHLSSRRSPLLFVHRPT